MPVIQQQSEHWRDRLIAKSEAISDAWEVGKAYAARIAEWILFICLIANLLEMFPIVPPWLGSVVLIVQSITLDVAGFGLKTMGDHARRRGNEQAANAASRMGWTLIGLMIVTVSLVTLSVLIPQTKDIVDWIEKALILARVAVTVFYAHIVHSLRQASLEYENEVSTLRQQVSTLQQEVSTLRPQLDSAKQHVDTLSGQLEEKTQEVDTLGSKLSTALQKVSTLESDLQADESNTSTLRKQMNEALTKAETLRVQLEGKQQEVEGLREQLQSGQDWQGSRVSSLQQALEAEQAAAATLRKQFHAVQCESETLRTQLEGKQQEVERIQSELTRGQQEVSTLQRKLDTERQRVDTLQRKLDSGQEHSVDSGQGKVVRLDTNRPRKSGQGSAADNALGEQIRALLFAEPGLSDRAIASRLSCSPTTVGKWRKQSDQESEEAVSEG